MLGGAHITEWLTAFGTMGAVFVSLFYGSVKRWICRPKITISCSNGSPFMEETSASSTSSSPDDKKLIIRVKVTNTGRMSADYANVCVDAIYKKRKENSSFSCKRCTPILIRDYRNTELKRIVPHLDYYLDIASIEKYDELITANEKGTKKQYYKLFLLGNGKSEMLGVGTFIIPLKFYSSNVKTQLMYVQIYWDSDNYTTDDDHFYVKELSKKEFDNINHK